MERRKAEGLSAAVLKHVAVLSMLIDHLTLFFFRDASWYRFGRILGRPSFILFAFLLAEGARRTQDRCRYASRLLLCAVISFVPFSYCLKGEPFYFGTINIFFTLLIGLLTICLWQWSAEHVSACALRLTLQLLLAVSACALAVRLHTDYSVMGVLLILVFYGLHHNPPGMLIAAVPVIIFGYAAHRVLSGNPVIWFQQNSGHVLSAVLKLNSTQAYGLFALPLIWFYNGRKGEQLPRWFYYGIYPAHLAVIALILVLG